MFTILHIILSLLHPLFLPLLISFSTFCLHLVFFLLLFFSPLFLPLLVFLSLLLLLFIPLLHPQGCREVVLVFIKEDSIGHLEQEGEIWEAEGVI